MKAVLPISFALTITSVVGLQAEVRTLVSPLAQADDEFGYSLAALGAGHVLVGDPYADLGEENAGAAYLFDLTGTLITAYTNPAPAAGDNFGHAVAGVGDSRVLISAWASDVSAYNAGIAYLFDVTGQLITTYTNPYPGNGTYFGYSVAAVGTNRVLIGSNADRAYLYDLEGNRLATCYNPTPETYDQFGAVVAAVGTNRLLVTAGNDSSILPGMGMAYLFDLAGALVTTFTNPTPAEFDSFGVSATGVGSDYVLIGATRDDAGAEDAGAAYLFDLAGHLITTYTNPAPAVGGWFGYAVAAVGNAQVLMSSYQGSGVSNTTCLYDLAGNLVTSFANPPPAQANRFGCAVASVGTDWVLVGAKDSSAAAPSAGAAFLFPLAPALAILLDPPGHATVSWQPNTPGWVLQETLSLSPAAWTNAPSGASNPVVVPATLPTTFYRLHKP